MIGYLPICSGVESDIEGAIRTSPYAATPQSVRGPKTLARRRLEASVGGCLHCDLKPKPNTEAQRTPRTTEKTKISIFHAKTEVCSPAISFSIWFSLCSLCPLCLCVGCKCASAHDLRNLHPRLNRRPG